jgi:hypothetical protein
MHALVSYTPHWVWALLAGLLYLGLRQTLTRQLSLSRITLMPLALAGLSLYGTVAVFGTQPLAWVFWAIAAAASAGLVLRRPVPRGTQFDLATQRFTVPGSVVPLLLIMGVFITKYCMGVLAALHPVALQNPFLALGASAVYGTFSGMLLARAMRYWRLAAAQDAAWHQGSAVKLNA